MIDLAVPFLTVFLDSMTDGNLNETVIYKISKNALINLEADVAHCLISLLCNLSLTTTTRVFSEEISDTFSKYIARIDRITLYYSF